MINSSKRQIITYFLLCILLAYRITVEVLQCMSSLFTKTGVFPAWFDTMVAVFPVIIAFHNSAIFGLIAIAVILNKDNVQSLNIDKFFVLIFLYSGLVAFLGPLSHHAWLNGWLTGVAWLLFLVYVLSKNNIVFGTIDPNVERISLIAIGAFVVCFIAAENFLNLPKISQNINLFFLSTIPSVVYEEAIFRGMLWKFLKNLQLSESKIVLVQAFLFWLAHMRYLISNPFNFWIFIPLVSLLLGYIVLRSKSLTPSTIAHMLINLFYGSLIISR